MTRVVLAAHAAIGESGTRFAPFGRNVTDFRAFEQARLPKK